MIYFIQADRMPVVKIGYSSSHPEVRLKALQCGSPVKLKLIGMAEGTRKNEGEWHRRFAHLRLHGEWFKWTPELKKAAKPHLRDAQIKRFAKAVCETRKLSLKHGFPTPYVSFDPLAFLEEA